MSQDPLADDAALAMLLLDIMPSVQRHMYVDAMKTLSRGFEQEGAIEALPTPTQLTLLRHLVERKCCTMQELAELLVVTPSTVTAMIKRLLSQGYVERSRNEADWRTVWIKPSERAQQVVESYNRARRASLQRRLERLSEEERQSLLAALPALRHLMEG